MIAQISNLLKLCGSENSVMPPRQTYLHLPAYSAQSDH